MHAPISKPRLIAWTAWVFASVFYGYQYILRVMPNIMLDDITARFQIGAAVFGQFSGIYYIGYSLMHLPIGIFLDRYGPRKVMTGCILISLVGLLPLIFTDYWVYPVIGRLLVGIGSSAAILGVFKIVRMTFSEQRFSRMLSFSVTIGLLGAIYGGAPVSMMRDALGYEAVVQLFIAGGLVLALAAYWIIPEMQRTSEKTSILSDIKEVLGNSRVILCCIFAGLMVGPLEGFADVWGSAFLKHAYGFESSLAAGLPSTIFIGMCFGAPLLSFFAEKLNNYFFAIVVAGAIMALSFTLLLGTTLTSGAITVSFSLVGVCCAYQILAIYKASTFVREQVAGLTTAVANMIIMVFGYLFHTVIGSVINMMGGINAPHALSYGIAVIPIMLVIATIGFTWMLLKERATVNA